MRALVRILFFFSARASSLSAATAEIWSSSREMTTRDDRSSGIFFRRHFSRARTAMSSRRVSRATFRPISSNARHEVRYQPPTPLGTRYLTYLVICHHSVSGLRTCEAIHIRQAFLRESVEQEISHQIPCLRTKFCLRQISYQKTDPASQIEAPFGVSVAISECSL